MPLTKNFKKYFFDLSRHVRLYIENWDKAEVGDRAAILSYTTVLSLVPFLAVFLSITKRFGRLYQWSEQIKEAVLKYATLGTASSFSKGLDEAIGRLDFETAGYVGLFATIVTSILMLNTINTAVQKTWNVEKFRSYKKRLLIYICFILIGPISAVILLAIASSQNFIPSTSFVVFYLAFLLYLLNKLIPNSNVDTLPAIVSSIFTAISLVILQFFFTWSVENLLNYNQVYGSLASLPLFLLWLYLVWYAVLLGIILCATLQSKTDCAKPSRLSN